MSATSFTSSAAPIRKSRLSAARGTQYDQFAPLKTAALAFSSTRLACHRSTNSSVGSGVFRRTTIDGRGNSSPLSCNVRINDSTVGELDPRRAFPFIDRCRQRRAEPG